MRSDAPRTPSPAEKPARVVVALMLAALAVAGCAPQAGDTAADTSSAGASRTPTSVPDVRRLTPAQAAGRLAGTTAPVVVVFPGYEATHQVDGTYLAGVRKPDRIERVRVGDSVWPLERIINHSRHLIASQSPPPGTPLSGTATITLTAGPHPDSEPRSWYRTHIQQVQKAGAGPCFECHAPTACAACHLGEEVVGTGRLIAP